MMSTFHNGLLRTMKANYTVSEGDMRVIRPLVYVREKALRDFAETQKLPIIPENCPACFEQPKVIIVISVCEGKAEKFPQCIEYPRVLPLITTCIVCYNYNYGSLMWMS